jgi:hypothetical protein
MSKDEVYRGATLRLFTHRCLNLINSLYYLIRDKSLHCDNGVRPELATFFSALPQLKPIHQSASSGPFSQLIQVESFSTNILTDLL